MRTPRLPRTSEFRITGGKFLPVLMSDPSAPTPTGHQRTTGGNFRWEPPTAEELQTLMPGYTIEKILGRGGMGAVYKGVQQNLDRTVAIKVLPPGVEKEDPSFAERFRSEAKLMAKLNHPAVVAVYDFGTTLGGQLYFAMEYVDGSDVSQMIRTQGKLPPEHALAITAHVCDALAAAHELGIVHRDIKPANVLLNMKGQVKVADFGLAKVEEPGQHGLTKTGYAMGTPDFVAPEVLMLGSGIDGRADLYAVGVMLYQMLTGEVPRGAFKPATARIPSLDRRYDPIIMKAMQSDREERYQSSAELRRDLDVILTVPLVKEDDPASAAIPVSKVAQMPAQRSATQKPQPRSAGAPTRSPNVKAVEGTRAPETPPKSKIPLFIGVAAAAAIGIGAFVMFGGGRADGPPSVAVPPQKALGGPSGPPAKPASVASATPKPASSPPTPKPAPSPVSSSPILPISKSSEPQFPPGKWVKVFTKPEDLPEKLRVPGSGVTIDSGWIRITGTKRQGFKLPLASTGNYGLRARVRREVMDDNGWTLVSLRESGAGRYSFAFKPIGIQVSVDGGPNRQVRSLINRPYAMSISPRQEYTFETAVVGGRLITRYNDELVQVAMDGTQRTGTGAISGIEDMRDIEVINLDGLPEAEALKILGVDEKGNDLRQPAAVASASPAPSVSSSPSPQVSKSSDPKFPPGQWVKLFTKLEDLPEDHRKSAGGVTFEDGWIRYQHDKGLRLYVVDSLSNYAIRATMLRTGKEYSPKSLLIRAANFPNSEGYVLNVATESLLYAGNKMGGTLDTVFLWKASPPEVRLPRIGEEYTLEWGCVGNKLVGRIGKEFVKITKDSKWNRGPGYFTGGEPIRDIEVINLDGLPEAEALRLLGVDEKGNDLRALAAKQEQQKAEQAKVVDAMAAIPELKALHEQFVKLTAERLTAPFEAEVAKLNAGYVGGIDREIASEKKAGHLDGVIALEAEKKLLADKQPVPAEDAVTTTDALKKLRGIYREAYAKIEAARAENLKTLTDPLDARLKQMEAALTQQDRITHAKTVREYREGLGNDGSADTPVRTASTGGAAATMNEADKSVRAPLKKFPPGDDRKAAEWVLSVGGRVQIYTGGQLSSVSDAAKLPRSKFSLLVVYLEFPDGAPKVPFTDMLPLAGLRELKQLQMLNAPVSDEALEIIPSLPNLLSFRADTMNLTDAVFAHFALSKLTAFHLLKCMKVTGEKVAVLANGKSLEQLSLQSCRLSDAGVQEIGKLASLTTLNLSGSGLNDDQLKALRGLKNLSSLLLKRNVLSAKALADMTTVWHDIQELEFDIRGGEVVSGSEVLARAFPKLETFGFSRPGATPYSATDLAGLKAFPKLKTIIMWNVEALAADAGEGVLALDKLERLRFDQCPAVTDTMMESLSNHKSLSSLRWAGLQITDISLTHIAKLRSLTKLEISDCPNLTPAAIAAFKKERSDVTVTQ